MISSVIGEYRSNSFIVAAKNTSSADGSFSEALEAAEYMRNELGINVDEIEPTHEITDEQMAWLNSRYDFSTMQRRVRYSFVNDSGITQYGFKSTAEYSNFLADLTYLGVFTPKELTEMWAVPIDTRPGANRSLLIDQFNEMWNSDDTLDGSELFVRQLEKMFRFYDERSKDPSKAVEGDAEFAALIRDHCLPLPKIFSEIVKKLSDDHADIPQSGAVPHIEDASDKLKDEFGRYFL